MLNRIIIFLNNYLSVMRRIRVGGQNILILAPRCLQRSECRRDVVGDARNCARCGQCRVGDLMALSGEYGLRVAIVNGGRQAVEAARDPAIRVVVAVACEKELAAGILTLRATKHIYAVRNIVRCKPCVDTDVRIGDVRAAVERIVCHVG